MVKEDTLAKLSGRMNVYLEHLGGAALQVECNVLVPIGIIPMSQPMGLNGMETLEIEDWLYQATTSRIAVLNRCNVDTQQF